MNIAFSLFILIMLGNIFKMIYKIFVTYMGLYTRHYVPIHHKKMVLWNAKIDTTQHLLEPYYFICMYLKTFGGMPF